jgi:hypothetical protein
MIKKGYLSGKREFSGIETFTDYLWIFYPRLMNSFVVYRRTHAVEEHACGHGRMKMSSVTLPNSLYKDKKKVTRKALQASIERWNVTLVFSSAFGTFCGLLGTILGTLSLFGLLQAYRSIDQLGIALLVAAFPLLILAAHSLDKAHEIDKAINIEYCRLNGRIDNGGKSQSAKKIYNEKF